MHRRDCDDRARHWIDLQGIKTNEVDKGDHHLLNGSRPLSPVASKPISYSWSCTNPDSAAGAKAFSILIVEDGMPGFERGRNLEKVGMKAQDTSVSSSTTLKYPRKIYWARRAWDLST